MSYSLPQPFLSNASRVPIGFAERFEIDDELRDYFDAFPEQHGDLPEKVRRVAPQDIPILLEGETGTGKTRLAKIIHQLSRRRNEPFITVNCGTLASNLIESELFGHVKGAFTGADKERPGKFAAAAAGTIFLDEINSLPLSLQIKLLRVLDEKVFELVGCNKLQPVRARVIAATNANLADEVAAGRFRDDLYFRLDIVRFCLPSLRMRRSSIRCLCDKFFTAAATQNRPDLTEISELALRALCAFDWPGNIRQLENVIGHVVALSQGPTVEFEDLPKHIQQAFLSSTSQVVTEAPSFERPERNFELTLVESTQLAEKERIVRALIKHRNNRLRTAKELGISRMGLYKKLHKYGLFGGVGA